MINSTPNKSSSLNNKAMSSSIISKYVNNGIDNKPNSSSNTSNSFKTKNIKKKSPLNFILGGIVLLFLIVGSAAAMYLTQNNQDVRQQAAGTSQIYCGGCLNRNMDAQDSNGTWMRCNDWIDRECQEVGCAGEGTSHANQQCCPGLNPCQNGRCGYSCTSDNKQQCGKYVEGSTCNNTGRWVCKNLNEGYCSGGTTQEKPTTTRTAQQSGDVVEPPSTAVSCSDEGGKLCNCAPNDLCVPNIEGETFIIEGGDYNGQTCFKDATSFTCIERETIATGRGGDSCEIGQRTACATDGCPSGQQRLCQGGAAGLGECTWTDRCIGDSDRGNGEVAEGQSCDGVRRVSGGEPSRGGFIGCQGNLNCFCTQLGVGTGQTYSTGNVVCYEDLHNDSCGAPGVGTPEVPTSTTTPETTTPPGYTPPPSTPPTADYFCNSTCENNSQCQTSDSNFICSAEHNNKCRLNTNPSSNKCQPPIGPMCLDIDLVDNQTGELITEDPSYGDTVKFTCAEVTGVDHYIFRVIEPDNNIVNLDATGRTSTGYTISKAGKFYAQCQICTTSDDSSCNSYEALN